MQAINICGEKYYKMNKVYEFIEMCNKKYICILCMEFFEIKGEKVIPCKYLQSIDSAELFDIGNDKILNVTLCNDFIKECIDKYFNSLKKMYFCVVVE